MNAVSEILPLTLIDAALRGTLLALLLLLAAVMGRDRPRLPASRAGVALMLGLAVQVVSSTPLFEACVPRAWQAPLVGVAVANAVLFWIFADAMFDDDFALHRWHVAAWLAAAALGTANCALAVNAGSPAGLAAIAAQRAVALVFALLAALAAASQWRADLVDGRRRLRLFIVVTGVLYTLVMVGARLAAPQGRLSGTTATWDTVALLAIVAVAAWHLLRLGGSDLFPSLAAVPCLPADAAAARRGPDPERSEPPPPDATETLLAERLQRLMAEDRAYRHEDLSVASLAARLAVPEYRLRRLINQRLGHRNFNAFVNGYRLAEARAALADPARRELPILTIALDAGFQSIGPFNRAFKATLGLTPSEFRKEHLADS
jgi:AraC-like DNA-binding protein